MTNDRSRNRPTPDRPYPLADTQAQRLLRFGLDKRIREKGTSLRKIADELGMASAMLSHMASGRMPIPVDRAVELARALNLSPPKMVAAVIKQRFPDASAQLNLEAAVDESPSETSRFEFVVGVEPDKLSPEKRAIIQEVARDLAPGERWLAIKEVPLMKLVRSLRPDGVTTQDYNQIRELLLTQ